MNRSDPRNRLPNDIFDKPPSQVTPADLPPPRRRPCMHLHSDPRRHGPARPQLPQEQQEGGPRLNTRWFEEDPTKNPGIAEYIHPTTTELPTEQTDMAPGYPDKKPFDVSFQPTPMLSATAPTCPFGTVGIDVVIPSTPQLSPPHNSLDVIKKVSANAEVHHQSYERQKLRRDGDRSEGDAIIGELL
ncbi:hypothetical protein THAOC_06919 [Thalassiosira oceanica]|uniref:Uncharacterized protein n=1 Tax=Thalassiosira oceanica TaxID=159749 RepID=K0TDR1_THAOC|nr:hypothetical protein THAOC_06919 [Thalassiosira oceanica]|eukprot:EJK71616.1 hypothetical protein THAOC_06919 [Thalassiosira oceanica]